MLGLNLLLQVDVLGFETILERLDLCQRLAQRALGHGTSLDFALHVFIEPRVLERDRGLSR